MRILDNVKNLSEPNLFLAFAEWPAWRRWNGPDEAAERMLAPAGSKLTAVDC
jgi:hypothetical protein